MAPFLLLKNQKGKDLLYLDYKYTYTVCKRNIKSLRWRCTDRDCSATLTTDIEKTKIIRQIDHVCDPDVRKQKVRIFIESAKQAVGEDMSSMQDIYEKLAEEYKDNGNNAEDIPPYSSVKSTLYRAKKAALNVDRLVYENEKRIHILHLNYHTDEKSVNIYPIIYALLPNKCQITYKRFFAIIKERFQINIKSFKCDYENSPNERPLTWYRGVKPALVDWSDLKVLFPDNYENTLKLDKDEDFKKRYNQEMDALLTKRYAELAPQEKA
ncbi:uncharacterized protein [Choristoneura fumiferana]|uniref:uncharacterized protein n=1 Tax=Choristoneura fumiferana TaxID=7141 RepID=UPI003D15D8B0